jgi:hypothetical protein
MDFNPVDSWLRVIMDKINDSISSLFEFGIYLRQAFPSLVKRPHCHFPRPRRVLKVHSVSGGGYLRGCCSWPSDWCKFPPALLGAGRCTKTKSCDVLYWALEAPEEAADILTCYSHRSSGQPTVVYLGTSLARTKRIKMFLDGSSFADFLADGGASADATGWMAKLK